MKKDATLEIYRASLVERSVFLQTRQEAIKKIEKEILTLAYLNDTWGDNAPSKIILHLNKKEVSK